MIKIGIAYSRLVMVTSIFETFLASTCWAALSGVFTTPITSNKQTQIVMYLSMTKSRKLMHYIITLRDIHLYNFQLDTNILTKHVSRIHVLRRTTPVIRICFKISKWDKLEVILWDIHVIRHLGYPCSLTNSQLI